MKGPKLRKLRLRVIVEFGITYTHEDRAGMIWRFDGARPVSALCDQVMAECGLLPRGLGYKPARVKLVCITPPSQRVILKRLAARAPRRASAA